MAQTPEDHPGRSGGGWWIVGAVVLLVVGALMWMASSVTSIAFVN
jgi:hypothetical protein